MTKNEGIMERYRHLAASIIEKASEDYRKAQKEGNPRAMLKCEQFFLSDWFQLLCGGKVDGKMAVKTLRGRAKK